MPRFVPIALNQGATLLLGIIGLKLISHTVPPAVYRSYGLFLTLTQVGLLLTHSGVINHASRYWQREQPRAAAYARFLFQMSWRKTLFLGLVLAAVSGGLALVGHNSVWLQLWPLLVIGNLVVALATLWNLVLNASEQHWRLLVFNTVTSAARSLLPVGAAVLFSATLLVLAGGFASHALPVGATLLILFLAVPGAKTVTSDVRAAWIQELRDFGRPFMVLGIGGWLLQNADRWIVAVLFAKEQSGVFNLASNMAAIVPNFAAAGLMQRVFPAIFRQADSARTEQDWLRLARKCDWATGAMLGLTLAGLLTLQWISPWLRGWLIDESYGPSLRLLLPAGMAALSLQANQFQNLLLQGQHDSSSMVKVMLVLATMRTVGSIAAAAVSWSVFLVWLLFSAILVAVVGRALIRQRVRENIRANQRGILVPQA